MATAGRDIVVPNVGGHSVPVLLGDGTGRFREAPGSPLPVVQRPFFTALGDVNRDGKLDIAADGNEANDVTVLLAR